MKRIFTLFLFVFTAVSMQVQAQNIVEVDSESALRAAVTGAAAGDIIQITADKITLTKALGTIVVDHSNAFTIRGAGPENTIIHGGWSGGDATDGTQLFYIKAGASVTIEGVTLQRGRAEGYGGAIYNNGSLFLTNCVLKENRAVTGSIDGDGGAICNYITGTATLKNCQLIANRADYIGGAIMSANALTVINCTLTGNQAGNDGGAINIQDGGVTALLMINTTITGNNSKYDGGGLLVAGGNTVAILNSIIVGNTIGESKAGKDIQNYSINFRMAYSAYGDLDNQGTLATNKDNQVVAAAADVLDTSGAYPKAKGVAATGGIMTAYDGTYGYYYNGTAWVSFPTDGTGPAAKDYLTVSGNTRMGAFEGISTQVTTQSDLVDPYDGVISLREAIANAKTTGAPVTFDTALNGKAIKLKNEDNYRAFTLAINESVTIRGNGPENTIIDGGWSGGKATDGVRMFYVLATASLTIEGVTLQRGRGGDYGGAIYTDGSLSLTNCVLKENSVVGYGGAIYNDNNGTAILTNCLLIDNQATFSGGAILNCSVLTVINCALTGNQAQEYGGAIYLQNSNATTNTLLMINTTITGNHSAGNGGGLLVASDYTATILNSIIVGNTADGDGDDIRNAITATILMAYSAYGELDNQGILATVKDNHPNVSAAAVLAEDLEPIGVAATGGIATGLKDGAAYYSTDNGANWTPVAGGAGITNAIPLTSTNNRAMGSTFRLDIESGVHYLLSFTVDEGIRINPAHLAYHIEEGHDYTFYMYMQEGFAHKKPYVTLNGQPVKIRQTQDGTGWVYRIPAVYADQTIEIVLQDLVSNLNPDEAGIVIYSSAGALIVEAAEPMAVTIYNITGQAVAQQTVDSRASFNLPKGIYIVRTNGKAVKAVVR
ncbi:DUF6383 domain-containing protein [Parabacteroides sp. OttesenSCG-928-G07]|nr:DUF6383 domain-containing protein [Parabacteroides sp. OttesenSCG-928-G07]